MKLVSSIAITSCRERYGMMTVNDELEGIWMEEVLVLFRCYSYLCGGSEENQK